MHTIQASTVQYHTQAQSGMLWASTAGRIPIPGEFVTPVRMHHARPVRMHHCGFCGSTLTTSKPASNCHNCGAPYPS